MASTTFADVASSFLQPLGIGVSIGLQPYMLNFSSISRHTCLETQTFHLPAAIYPIQGNNEGGPNPSSQTPLQDLPCMSVSTSHHLLVLNHQHKVQWLKAYLHHNLVQVCIHLTLGEAKSSEIAVDPSVPSTWCLFHPIQRSFEPAHMWLATEDLKSFRLLNVHLFLNDPIKKHSLHIHLMNGPIHLR